MQETETEISETSAQFLASMKEFLRKCNARILYDQETKDCKEGDRHLLEKGIMMGIRDKELSIVNKLRLQFRVMAPSVRVIC